MRLGCFGLSQRAETTIIAGWYGQGRLESGLKPGRCDNIPADSISPPDYGPCVAGSDSVTLTANLEAEVRLGGPGHSPDSRTASSSW